MISKKDDIMAALLADTDVTDIVGTNIYAHFPNDFNVNQVTYSETTNVPRYADNQEVNATLGYTVDVWVSGNTDTLVQAVDSVMKSIGFVRANALPETYNNGLRIYRRTLEYIYYS